MKETKFSKDFISEMEKKWPHMWQMKIHGHEMQLSGVPDNLFSVNGRFLSIEFKIQRDSKIQTTPLQLKTIEDIRNSSAESLIVAYDENREKILIKTSRLDWRKYLQESDATSKKIAIQIDWDFEFNHFDYAIDLLELLLE